jgi:hypothetical protein
MFRTCILVIMITLFYGRSRRRPSFSDLICLSTKDTFRDID